MHYQSFNEPDKLCIPEPIFQARAFKIGTNVGLNVLFNTSSGFYQKQHFFAEFLMFFYAFPSIAT